jgi:hypothetical protein
VEELKLLCFWLLTTTFDHEFELPNYYVRTLQRLHTMAMAMALDINCGEEFKVAYDEKFGGDPLRRYLRTLPVYLKPKSKSKPRDGLRIVIPEIYLHHIAQHADDVECHIMLQMFLGQPRQTVLELLVHRAIYRHCNQAANDDDTPSALTAVFPFLNDWPSGLAPRLLTSDDAKHVSLPLKKSVLLPQFRHLRRKKKNTQEDDDTDEDDADICLDISQARMHLDAIPAGTPYTSAPYSKYADVGFIAHANLNVAFQVKSGSSNELKSYRVAKELEKIHDGRNTIFIMAFEQPGPFVNNVLGKKTKCVVLPAGAYQWTSSEKGYSSKLLRLDSANSNQPHLELKRNEDGTAAWSPISPPLVEESTQSQSSTKKRGRPPKKTGGKPGRPSKPIVIPDNREVIVLSEAGLQSLLGATTLRNFLRISTTKSITALNSILQPPDDIHVDRSAKRRKVQDPSEAVIEL